MESTCFRTFLCTAYLSNVVLSGHSHLFQLFFLLPPQLSPLFALLPENFITIFHLIFNVYLSVSLYFDYNILHTISRKCTIISPFTPKSHFKDFSMGNTRQFYSSKVKTLKGSALHVCAKQECVVDYSDTYLQEHQPYIIKVLLF